jgi:hypothetical protein
MITDLKEASFNREESLFNSEIDKRIDLLLANYQRVTANPRSMGYLRFLMRHYAKSPTPWRDCFHPDTPVDCPRDHEKYPDGIPISKLKSGDLVWSFNIDQYVYELKEVGWSECIRKNAQLCMITLDSGKTIKATKDHKFMQRDGVWTELQDLCPGDSLMPFYRDYLPMVRLSPDRTQWVTEHEHVVQMRDGKDNRKGKHIHHADERRVNTSSVNLELLSSSEHIAKHHETVRDKVTSKKDMRKCRYCKNLFVPKYKNHLTCGECPESVGYVKQKIGKEFICWYCEKKFIATSSTQEFCSTECRKNQYLIEGIRRVPFPCNECGKIVKTRKNNKSEVYCLNCKRVKNSQPKQIEIRICKNCGNEFKKMYKNHVHCTKKCRDLYSKRSYAERNPGMAPSFNHKVVSVDILDEYSNVWDIEVKDNHNFVVQGVVVHNCVKDNTKRFGPEKVKGLCATMKDLIRQSTHWRGHPELDHGAPGVAIGEADKGAAPPWGGHKHLSETTLDCGQMAMPEDLALVLEDLGEKCDVYRVLIGLDEPPRSDLVLL